MSYSTLLNSRATIKRRSMTQTNGQVSYGYVDVEGGEYTPCRLDLQYTTPKDLAPAIAAGKAPDRYGRAFFEVNTVLKAGDIIEMIPNDYGEIPVPGTFEVRTLLEHVSGFSSQHHIEVQVWETQQALNDLWPSDEAV